MLKTNMPRDVATRWNSTFDMLEHVMEHWKAINAVTQHHDLGLRKFELADYEWTIAGQLQDVLKVSCGSLFESADVIQSSRSSRTLLCSFHTLLQILPLSYLLWT